MANGVDDYLRRLERELRRLGLHDAGIVASFINEARDHLVDAVDAAVKRGLAEDDAEREALERFGAPELIAAHVAAERNRMANRLGAALRTMWERKWWIVAPTVATAAVTFALSTYFLPTRYRSETTILAVPQRVEYPPSNGLRVTTTLYSRLEQVNRWVLSSRNLERLITDFDLFRAERENESTLASDLVEQMRRNIAIELASSESQNGDAYGFTVSFTASDPKLALKITERLASSIIDESLRDKEYLVEGTSQFLESQIEDVRDRIVVQETRLNEHKSRNRGLPLSQAELIPYEVLLDRYRALLIQREESRTAAHMERRQIGEQFRILEVARLPEKPVGPSRHEVNAAGTAAGFTLGLLLVSIRRKGSPDVAGH